MSPTTTVQDTSNESFVDKKMEQAYGAIVCMMGVETRWKKLWKCVVYSNAKQYDLPGGAVGREFVELLKDEVNLLADGKEVSERLICFTALLLHRDRMVKKGCDIRRLLEFERCTQQHSRQNKRNDKFIYSESHAIRVFTRLMLRGKEKEATRWITQRMTGHVLTPTELDSNSGKTVFEVLKEKHPMPGTVDPIDFIDCNTLPPLIDIDVTPSHVEKVAHCIRGGAGPGGTDSLQWQHFSKIRYS